MNPAFDKVYAPPRFREVLPIVPECGFLNSFPKLLQVDYVRVYQSS